MSVQEDPTNHPAPQASEPARQEAPPPPDPAPQDGAASGQAELLRAELDEAIRQAEEYLKLAQRTQADFVNFRRRTEEERAQQVKDASLTFILKLLPILDDFERALANATPHDLDSSWAKGIQLVERNLRGLLASEGVERIQAEGSEFNPWEHEAISYQPSAEVNEGHVLQVVRPGYRKADRVIRPAQVVVAARPA